MDAGRHFQTMSEPERHQICFFTPSTICCGGVVLDYFSTLMIINEPLLKDEAGTSLNVLRLRRIDTCLSEYTFSFFCLTDGRLVTFHHLATFPFYSCVK